MAFAPDGRIFVCQQGGQVRVIKNGVLLPTPFVSVSVDASGERGLLGIVFDPNFSTNGFVYVYYTVKTSPAYNRVSRFTAIGDRAVAGSEVLLLRLNNLSSATNHNGGALHFGLDGKLYVAVGENANGSNAQSLSNLLGKILRINRDGTIPADNPFYATAIGQNRAIWAYGLRNPYTFAFQPGTTRMFINDVGQSTWEEIDNGVAGANYGWPITEGPTTDPRFRSPIFAYGHGSSTTGGCAITGGAFYNPAVARFPANYLGKYFFADFCSGWIRVLDPVTRTAFAFASGIASPVDLQVGSDGALYYLARGGGVVVKIQFDLPKPAPDFNVNGSADIVLENNSTGQRALWLMNKTLFVQQAILPTGSVLWDIVGTGDFNADGWPDIVFQGGQNVAAWLMKATSYDRSVALPRTPPDWKVASSGDFNNDRKPDLVLENRLNRQTCSLAHEWGRSHQGRLSADLVDAMEHRGCWRFQRRQTLGYCLSEQGNRRRQNLVFERHDLLERRFAPESAGELATGGSKRF